MAKPRTLLQIEELETRDVPSVSPPLPLGGVNPGGPAILLGQAPQSEHTVGIVQGTVSTQHTPSLDAGVTYTYHGDGQFHFLGHVTLDGTIQTVGNIAIGHAGGQLTLSNGRGSITLQLVGPPQQSFAPLPGRFHFNVIDATGAFKGFQLRGNVDLDQSAGAKHFRLTFETAGQMHDTNALAGKGHGLYRIKDLSPDAGTTYHLAGHANVGLLGHVTVDGTLHSTGFIQNGRATGRLTLSNGQGSVVLQLTGPKQPGNAALPEVFHFAVVSATGTYRGLARTGSITLRLDPIMWKVPPGGSMPMPWESGGFHFTISPRG
jgi:hypothetical protein